MKRWILLAGLVIAAAALYHLTRPRKPQQISPEYLATLVAWLEARVHEYNAA